MLARRLNAAGVETFERFLLALKLDQEVDVPFDLLTSADASEPLDVEVIAEPRTFHSRLEIAEHIYRTLKGDPSALRSDSGFWTWLSLCWFDELCMVANEHRIPGDSVRWIADLENPRRACRHLLAGPFQIYLAHREDPERAMCLLCGSIHQTGPLVHLIAARPSLATCPAVVGAATRLYYHRSSGKNRSGLGSRGPGSPRRFTDILSQLELTWDLHSLSTNDLLELLPPEFDHFHRPESRGQQQRSLLD